MRLDLIPPEHLSAEQRPLYDSIKAEVQAHFGGFTSVREDGALVGPFNAMLHFPQFAAGVWAASQGLSKHTTLPKAAHEVAILVTGARFSARYELYAHEQVAAERGLSASKIATIAAGERPADLTMEEGVAYDVAARLCRGGQLPEATYQAAVGAFGEAGMAELAFLVGNYCVVSVLLNAFDVPVPGRGDAMDSNR